MDEFFQNQILFGNSFLEDIPHPSGLVGYLLNVLTIISHYFASTTFFVVIIPLIYFFYSSRFGIKLAVAVVSTGIINGLQKFIFSSPRPIGLSQQFTDVQSHIKELSFGFPSGHAHTSILLWGLIYLHFKNIYIRVFSIFFILFTPFSRMYAGVHFLGDVVGGFFTGLVCLIVIEWFFIKNPRFPDVMEWKSPTTSVTSTSLAVLAATLSLLLLESEPISIAQKNSLIQIVSASGSAAGLWLGITRWKLKFSNYDLEDIKVIPTVLLLLIAISLFYLGLGRVSEHFFKDSLLFRFIRYYILNLVIIYTVPYLSLVIIGEKENPT